MYGVGFGIGAIGSTTILKSGGAAYSYLLDAYSGSSVAYSLRKLSSTYSGNCIRVRRSSDNAEQNIGFVANVLDTATLLSFVGSGSGFVTTWYDQSGNANNASNSNATLQPEIVTSGVLKTLNTKPTIYSAAGKALNYNNLTVVSSFIIGNATSLNTVNYVNQISGFGGTVGGLNGSFLTDGSNTIQDSVEDSATKLLSALSLTTGNTSRLFVNNVAKGTSTILNNSNVSSIFSNPSNAGPLSNIGNLSEVIYYSTNQYTNFTGINTNINTFYGIY